MVVIVVVVCSCKPIAITGGMAENWSYSSYFSPRGAGSPKATEYVPDENGFERGIGIQKYRRTAKVGGPKAAEYL